MEWWRGINGSPVLLPLYYSFGYEWWVLAVITTPKYYIFFCSNNHYVSRSTSVTLFFNSLFDSCWFLAMYWMTVVLCLITVQQNCKFCLQVCEHANTTSYNSIILDNAYVTYSYRDIIFWWPWSLFCFCIRNFWSISTCCCNREPTQTLKWFIACFFTAICGAECPIDTVSWCSWFDSCEFIKYPLCFQLSP